MTVTQKQLILAWFGLIEPRDVDGVWGDQSRGATMQLQRKLAIDDDGVFGEETKNEALNAMSNGIEVTEDTTTGSWWDDIEFFDREEFMCTCNGRGCSGFPVEPAERLVWNLDDVRKHFGKPVIISSGVRCDLRNSELPGSAGNSLHKRGKAADFCVRGQHSSITLAYVQSLPEVDEAYAIDDSFVHMGVQKYQ